jgi:hypothetical protein
MLGTVLLLSSILIDEEKALLLNLDLKRGTTEKDCAQPDLKGDEEEREEIERVDRTQNAPTIGKLRRDPITADNLVVRDEAITVYLSRL